MKLFGGEYLIKRPTVYVLTYLLNSDRYFTGVTFKTIFQDMCHVNRLSLCQPVLASHKGISSGICCSISDQTPCYVPGKKAEDHPNVWAPACM